MMREFCLAAPICLGAGFGGVLRHAVNRLTQIVLSGSFPVAPLLINVSGPLCILAGWFAFCGGQSHQEPRLFLTTGFVGGFTTFSAVSLDLALLWERGPGWPAFGYAGAVGISLLAVFGGLAITRTVVS